MSSADAMIYIAINAADLRTVGLELESSPWQNKYVCCIIKLQFSNELKPIVIPEARG